MTERCSTEHFLCVCDVLVTDKQSVTFDELARWAAFVMETPIRALYKEGRKFFCAPDEERETARLRVIAVLDESVIAAYLVHADQENLFTLGSVMEVLGKNAKALVRREHCMVVQAYVNLFVCACEQ